MRRYVGGLLAAGILSSGIAVGAASPSSALPRNGCLDEAHWWQTLSQLDQAAQTAWGIAMDWDDAHEFQDLAGTTMYYVDLDGQYVSGLSLSEVQAGQRTAHARWEAAFAAAYDFYNDVAICTL